VLHSASYAVSASFAPDDGDWIIGSTFMTASGQDSVYIPNSLRQGQDTTTTNNYAHAEGRETEAFTWAHAEGYQSKATANYSHAEGWETLAENMYSHAEGRQTTSSGQYSHAEGQTTKAVGIASHAEGGGTRAEGWWSHAEGAGTLAEANYSHAEGNKTLASGTGSHSGGNSTTASLDYQTVVGQYNVGNYPNGNDTFVVGTGTSPSNKADGLKVRANTHEVIIAPSLKTNTPVNYSNPDDTTPNAFAGLYFGEPQEDNTIRITRQSPNNINSLVIQENQSNNGPMYTNTMALFQSTVQFVAFTN
jgi:hypothetical protein